MTSGSALGGTSTASISSGSLGITCRAAELRPLPTASWVMRRTPTLIARCLAVAWAGSWSLALAMERQYVAAFRAEMLCQFLDQVDRAMATARAADRHRDIAAILALEARQPGVQPASDVGIVFAHQGVRVEEFPDGEVLARERAQPRIPVGIGQAARVEDEIGVGGQAPAVGERLEKQGGAVRGRRIARGEQAAQLR